MSASKFASKVNVSALKNTASGLITKVNTVAKPLVFSTQVALQVMRKVAVHQQLVSPGSFTEAQAGIARFFTAFQTGAWKKVTVREAGYLGGQVATVAGFFYLGEMIGRKQVVGYNVAG